MKRKQYKYLVQLQYYTKNKRKRQQRTVYSQGLAQDWRSMVVQETFGYIWARNISVRITKLQLIYHYPIFKWIVVETKKWRY